MNPSFTDSLNTRVVSKPEILGKTNSRKEQFSKSQLLNLLHAMANLQHRLSLWKFDIYFSNLLIIHEDETKEIATVR